ncbi:MAG TPA: glycosyltransferase, partial [Gemmataceae bacterium]|nr:glycosyltransferase [Gemmataceae bacterium]
RVLRLREASLPNALYQGRLAVTTAQFAFLDDDDEYLPDALVSRAKELEANRADIAVGNGFNTAGELLIRDMHAVKSDPLEALYVNNWLASCGGLYRSATVPAEFFKSLVKYLEWTTLAFQLLMAGKKFCFVEPPTFRLSDTEGSASKQQSMESILNSLAVVDYMYASVPRAARANLSAKRVNTYHTASATCLSLNHLTRAWRLHLSCLLQGGWTYLSYTRHLVYRTLTTWLGQQG